MSTWRRLGVSGILSVVIGLAILPGCGGGAGNTTGPNPEVEIVPPKDAQGKSYPISDETKPRVPAK
jgi:hypothetical protein